MVYRHVSKSTLSLLLRSYPSGCHGMILGEERSRPRLWWKGKLGIWMEELDRVVVANIKKYLAGSCRSIKDGDILWFPSLKVVYSQGILYLIPFHWIFLYCFFVFLFSRRLRSEDMARMKLFAERVGFLDGWLFYRQPSTGQIVSLHCCKGQWRNWCYIDRGNLDPIPINKAHRHQHHRRRLGVKFSRVPTNFALEAAPVTERSQPSGAKLNSGKRLFPQAGKISVKDSSHQNHNKKLNNPQKFCLFTTQTHLNFSNKPTVNKTKVSSQSSLDATNSLNFIPPLSYTHTSLKYCVPLPCSLLTVSSHY